jgi:cyclase
MYKRIIGLVLIDNGLVCRTRNFKSDYCYTETFIDTAYFDEIAFIDVTAKRTNKSTNLFAKTIDKLMTNSQLPVAIGGGITSIEDIKLFRKLGADRYIINQTSPISDELIDQAIKSFGSSSIISTINHWGENTYEFGRRTQTQASQRIREVVNNCGSEILLNSVELDGGLSGFDLENAKSFANISGKSILLSGGIGNWIHASEALSIKNISGVCTSNIFHLTTTTVLNWRKQIFSSGVNVRSL